MSASSAPKDSCLTVHVFRVEEGLGNACLLQFPDETCAILDWGTQSPDPLESALEIGKRGFRFVAASHAHADHALGLAKLLRECKKRKIEVQWFVYPASTLNKETAHLTKAREAADECGIPMFSIGVDTFLAPAGERKPPCLAWADDLSWDVRVLSPSLTAIASAEMRALKQSTVAGNETSLVVLFRFVGRKSGDGLGRALFPGDATSATLAFARRTAGNFAGLTIDNQMFLVPHHGSRRNLPAWIADHAHGIVVVSGTTNSSYHPSSDVLKQIVKWNDKGGHLFCTSYAQCCAKAFGRRASAADRALVQPGGCFGNVVIRIPRSAPAEFKESSESGNRRRRFGYCGNP
jgi:hypothetical protein